MSYEEYVQRLYLRLSMLFRSGEPLGSSYTIFRTSHPQPGHRWLPSFPISNVPLGPFLLAICESRKASVLLHGFICIHGGCALLTSIVC
jgi:hypothetical protein